MTDQYRRGLEVELSGLGYATAGDPELRMLSNVAWAIRRSILWILAIAVGGAFLAYLFTYTADTKYTSSAKVMIETRVQTETQFTPQVSGLPLSLTSLESELQLLRSTDLIESVVARLDLQNDPEFSGEGSGVNLNPIALARGLKNAVVDALSGGDDGAEDGERSEDVLRQEAAIESLLRSRRIEQVGDTSAVYEIRVTSESKRKAARIANSLASEYLSVLTRMKRDALGQSQDWLAIRIGQLREDLNTLSSNLETHSIEIPYSPDEYATIKAQRIKAERRSSLASESLVELEEQTTAINLMREQGKNQEAVDYAAQVGLLSRSSNGDITDQAAIAALDAIQTAAERKIDQLNAQLATLKQSIETFKEQQARQVQHDSVTKRIENEILVTEAIYRDFVSQLGRRAEQGDYLDAGAHIIERARPSVDPSEPKRSQTAIGVMFAIVFGGLIWTVLHEIFQKRLRTTQEFESATGSKLSAILPEIRDEPPFETFFAHAGKLAPELRHFGRKLLASSDIGLRVSPSQSDPAVAQNDPYILTNPDKKTGQSVPQTHCVIFSGASALPDEGKSSALLLLAAVCAKAEYRTLIIDCDTVASAYRVYSRMTPEALQHAATDPEFLLNYVVGSPQEGLDILPLIRGQGEEEQTNAGDFLYSPAFLDLLHSLSDMYDVILLDTPPLLSAVESSYLSQIAHRVLLFTRWNSTRKNAVFQAIRELENADLRPSALVATRVDLKKAKLYGDPNFG
ncbi:exopolysaccharide transport family protein [Ruegeria arenilitoris]|uniref:exopolysaccharide transport family protein n=1 Tax=Ruegeria arenilitoris TaxID=1173585 RepID=UPI0014817822|nr:exopolysaccharide transport family protein [Ruegeria arenilitoris]